jgi:Ca2+/Na+ antiporter
MSTTTQPSLIGRHYSRRRIAAAAVIAAAATGLVDALIGVVALALGAKATLTLSPGPDVAFAVIASIAGAIGWTIIARRANNPRRALKIIAPVVLLLSFIPDVLFAAGTVAQTGWAPVAALVLMHIATISLALATYAAVLPIRKQRGASQSPVPVERDVPVTSR